MQNNKRRRFIKFIVIPAAVLVTLAPVITFAVPLVKFLVFDKQHIIKEMAALQMPASAREYERTYNAGICFDGCPSLNVLYDIDEVNAEALASLEKTLKENDYADIHKNPNGFIATKDNGSTYLTIATLNEDKSYKGIVDDTRVHKLSVTMTYNHAKK